jgi:hypothetical protein
MSAVSVAEARRADRVKAINQSIASLDKQVQLGAFSAQGSYARNHADWCRGEIAKLQADIARLGALDDKALVAQFCPELAREAAIAKDIAENGPVDFDPLGRGAMQPKQTIVNRTPLPARREGPEPAPVAPGLAGANGQPLPQGVVYGYDKDFNVVVLG